METRTPDAYAWMDEPLAVSAVGPAHPTPIAHANDPAPIGYEAPPLETGAPDDATASHSTWSVASAIESLRPRGFAEWFIVAQTALPAMLFLPGSQSLRLPIRMGAYAIPLAGLCLWWARGQPRAEAHPASPWLRACVLWLALMLTHPLTNTVVGGIAQTVLYTAVFCGVFWAPSMVSRRDGLVRILALLLICNGLNATVGVLQAYDPDRWMPRELSYAFQSPEAIARMSYVGGNGRTIVRPPGLFDTPGAVCGPGTVAAVLGLIFALQPLPIWKRGAALAFSAVGLAAIYLSHVRANFMITLGMLCVYGAALLIQRQKKQALTFVAAGVLVVVTAFVGASVLGGDAIAERFSTLVAEDPRSVYYASRGQQLQDGFSEFAARYPLGAGLARWGLTFDYFGDRGNLDSPPLWAEIQPTAWLIDGGLILVLFYAVAIVAVIRRQWRLVIQLPDADDRLWAAAVMAVNAGTIALVFSFVPFVTQVGVQFWFLEGALHGALGHALIRDREAGAADAEAA